MTNRLLQIEHQIKKTDDLLLTTLKGLTWLYQHNSKTSVCGLSARLEQLMQQRKVAVSRMKDSHPLMYNRYRCMSDELVIAVNDTYCVRIASEASNTKIIKLLQRLSSINSDNMVVAINDNEVIRTEEYHNRVLTIEKSNLGVSVNQLVLKKNTGVVYRVTDISEEVNPVSNEKTHRLRLVSEYNARLFPVVYRETEWVEENKVKLLSAKSINAIKVYQKEVDRLEQECRKSVNQLLLELKESLK